MSFTPKQASYPARARRGRAMPRYTQRANSLLRALTCAGVIDPRGAFIERAERGGHYDGGRFPGLRIPQEPPTGVDGRVAQLFAQQFSEGGFLQAGPRSAPEFVDGRLGRLSA